MPPTRRALLLAAAWPLATAVFAAELPPLTSALTAVAPAPAPDFAAADLDGNRVTLDDYRGEVLVVNFWATWCPPCRREMPSLERLNREVGDDIAVVAVNVGEDFETVFGFLGGIEPTPSFPVLLDSTGELPETWGVRGLPTTFVVDRAGNIAYRAVGGREFDHPDIVRALRTLSESP